VHAERCLRASEAASDARHALESALKAERASRSADATEKADGEYQLGVALARLGLPQAALSAFSRVVADAKHPWFGEAMPWVAKLLPMVAGTSDLELLLLRQDAGAYERWNNDKGRVTYDALAYLRGRSLYEQKEYEAASEHLLHISAASPFFVRGQFLLFGVGVSRRKSVPAAQALNRALDVLRESSDDPIFADLAYLDLARLHYTAMITLDDRSRPKLDAAKGNAALRYWSEVEPEGELGERARFEQAWGFFMAGDGARVTSKLRPFTGAQSEDVDYPEATVLLALSQLRDGQKQEARATLSQSEERYSKFRVELARLRAALSAAPRGERYAKVRAAMNDSRLGKALSREARTLHIRLRLEYLELLSQEDSRRQALPPAFRESSLEALASEATARERARITTELGDAFFARLSDRLVEIDEMRAQVARLTRG
jgi:hypothetical protein